MSDESRFFLDGHVASHNNIIWATKDNRPTNHFVEEQLNSPSVHVWCAISSSAFIGPFFFDGNVNGNSYLDLLQQRMMPEMEALLGDEMHRVIFMQDGATPHRCTHVRQWLSETFPDRTVGLQLHCEWPARSPDLSTCDFFLWGYLKELIYVRRPFANVVELQETIEDVCYDLRSDPAFLDKLSAASQAFLYQLQRCIELGGKQVESDRF